MSQDIVDMAELMDRVLEDKELIEELFDDFIRDFTPHRKELQAALGAKDFDRIQNIVHKIKGGAGNISIKAMHTCCMLIEQLAGSKDSELINELLIDLDAQFEEFKQYVADLKQNN